MFLKHSHVFECLRMVAIKNVLMIIKIMRTAMKMINVQYGTEL